jgi:hypothetical protein
MSTARVTRILKLVAELDEDERTDLAAQLEDGPEGLEWTEAELQLRVSELEAAEARGELGGLALTIDEAIGRARRDP